MNALRVIVCKAGIIYGRLLLCYHLYMCRLLGLEYAVKYLRNPDPRFVVPILRRFGASVGEGTRIKRSLVLDNVNRVEPEKGFINLVIGYDCYIGDHVFFDLAAPVVIGDHVIISGNSAFITHADCNRSNYLNSVYPRDCRGITVKDGAWIAFGATLLCGVTVEENTTIAARALLTRDAERRSLYAGVPAVKKRVL